MHTCQIMLVEADSAEEAINEVKSQITYSEYPFPAWSDWHEIGGRWDGLFAGWEETRNALCYTENSALAEDIIKDFAGYRKQEMKRNLAQINSESFDLEKMIEEYDPENFNYAEGMKAWNLLRLAKLLSNDWCSDTGVFDLKEQSVNLEFFRKRLEENPTRQYLVPVDFHF